MPIQPNSIDDFINFAITHADTWKDAPEQVGLSRQQADEAEAVALTMRSAREASVQAHADAESATITQDAAIASGRKKFADYIGTIKLHAERQTDPNDVYAAADLPLPKPRRALPAPETPANIKASLNTDGSILITWQPPARGAFRGKTFFQVQRTLTGSCTGAADIPYDTIAVSHDRRFMDLTIPAGYTKVTYRIIASRNGKHSDVSQEASVNFGTVREFSRPSGLSDEDPAKAA